MFQPKVLGYYSGNNPTPVQPFVMIWGGLATLAGLIWIPLGQIVGWIAWLFLAWTIGMIELTSQIPGASIGLGNIHVAWIVAYYVALGGLTWWGTLPLERRASLRTALAHRLAGKVRLQHALAGMVIVVALAALALVKLPDGKLHVDFLDVGQADAVFIQTPAGRYVLVDAGGSASGTLDQLGRRLPFWDHSLDVAIIARSDDAHLAAWTAVLERYQAGIVIAPPGWGDPQTALTTPTMLRLSQVIAGQRAQVVPAVAGTRLQLDRGVDLEIVGAPDSCKEQNCETSLSIRLAAGNVSFLLAGESVPPNGWPASTVLRLARHGSEQANPPELLEGTSPTVAIVSIDANNRFGLPSPAVLGKLSGRTVFRTDQHGSIHISTDGTQLWAQPERQADFSRP